jgi:hypothetical protein
MRQPHTDLLLALLIALVVVGAGLVMFFYP